MTQGIDSSFPPINAVPLSKAKGKGIRFTSSSQQTEAVRGGGGGGVGRGGGGRGGGGGGGGGREGKLYWVRQNLPSTLTMTAELK